MKSTLKPTGVIIFSIIVFFSACCKPQKDEMACSNYCFKMRGKIICKPDNTPLKSIDLRFRARRSTGIGSSSCRLIETKTNGQGEYEFSADVSRFLNDEDNYSFDLFFKEKKYKNSDASLGEFERTLAAFYDVDSANVDSLIVMDFYLEKD